MDTNQPIASPHAAAGHPQVTEGGDSLFYYSPEFYQRLDLLKHLTRNSPRMLLVSGPEGVGKSTLLDQFEANAEQDWMRCRIAATPMLQPDQLLIRLVRCFGATDAEDSLESALLRRFHDLQRSERLPVIMIDDTHQLPPATLALLYRLHHKGQEEGVHAGVLLFALPEIDRLLQAELLDAHQLQRLELLPLDSEQTAKMVDRLIRIQGLSDTTHLSGSQLGKLYRFSGGLPGEIRRLVQDLLREGDPGRRGTQAPAPSLFSDLPISVLAGGALLVVLIGLTLIYQDEVNRLFEGKAPEGELPVIDRGHETVVPLLLPEPADPGMKLPDIAVEQPGPGAGDLSAGIQPLPQQSGGPEAEPEAEGMEADSPRTAEEERPAVLSEWFGTPGRGSLQNEAMETEPAAPAATGAKPDSIEATSSTGMGKSPLKKTTEPALQPLPPAAHPIRERPPQASVGSSSGADQKQPVIVPAVENISLKQATEPAVERAPTKEPGRPERPLPAAVKEEGMRREAWLLGQEPAAYTLQLIGLGDEKAVARFIERHRLNKDVAYFRSNRDGTPWYSVLYGIYPNRDAAVAARATLPGKLGHGVWPRTLGSVQQAIRGK